MGESRSTVLVPLAPGFEEIEAVTIIDVLRRAEIEVRSAGLERRRVEGSHGITMHADTVLDEVDASAVRAVVLPGGMPGSQHLHDDPRVTELIRAVADSGGVTAAICAAPMALAPSGVTDSRRVTSYPTFRDRVKCSEYVEERVVIDGPVITSRGVGTALEFATALVAVLKDEETAAALRDAMLIER